MAVALFLALWALAFGLVIAGVGMIGGMGPALIVAGICAALSAWALRRGMTVG